MCDLSRMREGDLAALLVARRRRPRRTRSRGMLGVVLLVGAMGCSSKQGDGAERQGASGGGAGVMATAGGGAGGAGTSGSAGLQAGASGGGMAQGGAGPFAGATAGGSGGGAGTAGGDGGSGGAAAGAAGEAAGGASGAAGAGGVSAGGAGGSSGRGGGGAAGAGAGGGGAGGAGAGGADPVGPLVLSEDGGWCWFQSPRALFQGERLIVGSVASGWNGASRRGDTEAIVHDLGTGTTTSIELHNQLELDDHDAPALLARPDGRLLALFAKHGSENHFYFRRSAANAPTTWEAEKTFTPSASTELTYSNLIVLSAEQNRVYDFYRGLDASYKPSYAYSDDLGETWHSGNVVINVPSTALHRPYARYASNGVDTIHILYTEAHPRDFDNSIYHVYYRSGSLYRSDGTAIRSLAEGLASPDEGTRIFQGNADNVAWTIDVALDENDWPRTVYSVQLGSAGLPVGQGGNDLRYRYARWDGSAWRDYPLAYAGTRLYSGEDDYSGLASIDPTDTSVVYISTNADPASGAPLTSSADSKRHYELFRGVTADAGATWQWTPVTHDSTLDNLRPIVVGDGAGQKALLWLRGTYRAYTDYQQQVMALFFRD